MLNYLENSSLICRQVSSRHARNYNAPYLGEGPGKQANRPYTVLELDLSGFRTNRELWRIASHGVEYLKDASVTLREVSSRNPSGANWGGAAFAIAAVKRATDNPHVLR